MNWYKTALLETKNYDKSIEDHVQGVLSADLSYPVFVTVDNMIIDGVHRTIKVKLQGGPVEAIVLTPEELKQATLNPDETYNGQVYMSDFSGGAEEYSVNRVIELYKDKSSTPLDPGMLLDKNGQCWGTVSPYEVMDLAKQQMENPDELV